MASELTARALVVGAGIGVVLAAANTYSGLKTGFIDGGSISATLIGSALLGLWGRRAASPLELNLVQTVAASAAVMSFVAGLCAAVPALSLVGHRVSAGALFGWGVALAALGIALGYRLRGRLIESEALPFPTGQATAEVVQAVAADRGAGRGRLRSLAIAALVAGVLTWLRDGALALVPQAWIPGLALGGVAAGALTLGLSASPLLISTGVLVGPRVAISMALGAAVAWAGLAPAAVRAGLVAEAGYASLVPILLWPGLALLVGGAFTTLALAWPSFRRSTGDLRTALGRRGAGSAGTGGRSLLGVGVGASLLAAVGVATAIGSLAFGLPPMLLLGLLPIAAVLSAACGRAAGETDQAPAGQVGAVVQLAVGSAGVVPSLGGGALVTGMATQAAQTLWALKAGQRLGASPRAQVLAQLVGALLGAAVVVPVFALVCAAYPLGSEHLPAPGALAWKATAEAAVGAATFNRPNRAPRHRPRRRPGHRPHPPRAPPPLAALRHGHGNRVRAPGVPLVHHPDRGAPLHRRRPRAPRGG